MSVFERKIKIQYGDVTVHGELRPSALLKMITESGAEHYAQLNAENQAAADKNYLLVIVFHDLQISRMPKLGETVTLETWPGKTTFVLFPRYTRILDEAGQVIITSNSRWTLMDRTTRQFASLSRYQFSIPEEHADHKMPSLPGIQRIATTESREITVPYCFVDINGHLSNAHYLDLAENVLPEAAEGRKLREINIEYSCEIPAGKTFTLSWGAAGNRRYFSGDAERHLFRMNLDYGP